MAITDPIPAGFVSTDTLTVAGNRSPEFALGVRVLADCGVDGLRLGTVTSVSYASGTGLTTVGILVDAGGSLTSHLTSVFHGNNTPDSLCSHVEQHYIGGRDAFLRASTTFSGVVKLATTAQGQAGTDTQNAITSAVLAVATKLLISANLTIYVATTGSDSTGDGSAGAPYATIAKALSSIAGKLIASGVAVTIQVADGTYTISSLAFDHPDGDKIYLYGNNDAETTIAISTITAASRLFVVAGDRTSVSGLAAGYKLTVPTGTAANIGVYTIESVTFNGTNTEIVVSETVASDTVGGASLVAKPCNKCFLNFTTTSSAISINKPLSTISGFRITGNAAAVGLKVSLGAIVGIQQKNIIYGFSTGILSQTNALVKLYGCAVSNCGTGMYLDTNAGAVFYTNTAVFDNMTTRVISANNASIARLLSKMALGGHNPAVPYTPAIDTVGNGASYIASAA